MKIILPAGFILALSCCSFASAQTTAIDLSLLDHLEKELVLPNPESKMIQPTEQVINHSDAPPQKQVDTTKHGLQKKPKHTSKKTTVHRKNKTSVKKKNKSPPKTIETANRKKHSSAVHSKTAKKTPGKIKTSAHHSTASTALADKKNGTRKHYTSNATINHAPQEVKSK